VDRGVSAEVVLQIGDGERLPFPSESFDFVVMAFVVSVTPNPHVLMAEVTRVLRPAGTLLIVNHFSGVRGITWIERAIAPFAARIGFRSNFPIKRLLTQSSLNVSEVKPLGAWGLFHLVKMTKVTARGQD
jgi:phosphatidylethanolamine/phosphatidyl-N-methylethanolamine N-methyltransferase